MTSALAREFLPAYPTPEALTALTPRQWQRWARGHRLTGARAAELWTLLRKPQLPVPAHVVRAKARLMQTLVAQTAAGPGDGRPVPEGHRRFFREYAGGTVGTDPPDR